MSTTVVVGAGPYGLSVAAHLRRAGEEVQVLGRPLEFWEGMPEGMFLKSSWSASSLSDPGGSWSLDRFAAEVGDRPEPIPLAYFLAYCRWFQERAVPELDGGLLACLRRGAGGFTLELTDGRCLEAARVVMAVGIARFRVLPEFAHGLPPHLASHSGDLVDPAHFRDRRVAVLGAGQSALEWAALLHEAGARVELLTRRPVVWVDRRLYHLHPLLRSLFYAPSDVGPAGLSRLAGLPGVVRHLPRPWRAALLRRCVRPAGADWLRPRVAGIVPVTSGVEVQAATPDGDGLELELSDGSRRRVDHLVLATGYRPDLAGLEFLDPELRRALASLAGLPVLDHHYQSSVAGLHFVGALAEGSFGPICRFVAGAGPASRQVAAACPPGHAPRAVGADRYRAGAARG
jgi:NADPH-dependent 2,4-dienoyl-CoA reductase/sulfur reductase-like enzyme